MLDAGDLGLVRVRVSGLEEESTSYIVVDIEQGKHLKFKKESLKKLVSNSEIVSLIDCYGVDSVFFIRINGKEKSHECEWFFFDDTEKWEMTCGD